MSSVLDSAPQVGIDKANVLKWAPVLIGLLIMYVPTYIDLAQTFWKSEDNAHGPLILAVVLWLIWRRREVLLEPPIDARPLAGGLVLAFGLFLYVIGRSQQFFQPDAFSQIPVLLGIILALQGKKAFKALLFPIAFLVFSVPLPGSLLDAILLPLKQNVSGIVEHLLYWLGYPIARSGVILNIGPYQLLIADACSGLNSMIALSSVGLLFVYLMRNPSIVRNAILILLILPIAFLANVLRVMTLVLVTYHFGDAIGHSFHDIAGYAEIVFAFGAFFVVDWFLSRTALRTGNS
jgi:exosortase B